jgi:hypothetical protein
LNDRSVVHFRTEKTSTNVRMSVDTNAYLDVRSLDGSLAAKVGQKGDIPLSNACGSGGSCTSSKMNDAG